MGFQLSQIISIIETISLNLSVDELVVVLNVLSEFIKQSDVFDKKSTSSSEKLLLNDDKVLLRAAVIYLQVINLYYTVYIESKVQSEKNTQSFVPDSPLKTVDNRMHDISHLVGTGIHQIKGANYNDSDLLKSLESIVKGSYKNYMESSDEDIENKFLDPLRAAFSGLSKLLSKFTFSEINAFIDELLLYLNQLLPFAVKEATDRLCQLLNSLFSRNLHLEKNSLKRSLSMHKYEFDCVSGLFNDFAHYLAKVSNSFIEECILSWV